jgi:uncharacterized membrane protein (DUF373 family)
MERDDPPRDPALEARDSNVLESIFHLAEAAIYVVVGVLLVAAAAFTVVDTIDKVIQGSDSRSIPDTTVFVLSRVLLMFILAELLYTLRLVNFGGRILVEPFLFIALIAVVRRVLIVTAEFEGRQGRAEVTDFLIQIGALAGLVLVLALSIHLLRRSAVEQP